MEIRNLKTFLCAAERGSFTQAAQCLDYAQSTITAQIQSLEEELGVELFIRRGKLLTLSAAGNALLHYARHFALLEGETLSYFHGEASISGDFHIGVFESINVSRYMGCLAPFLRRHPNVTLHVHIDTTINLRKLLRKGELALIILLDTPNTDTEFHLLHQKETSICFIQSGRALPLGTEPIPFARLADASWILAEKRTNYRRKLEEELAQRTLYPKERIEIGSTKTIVELVAENIGISLLPSITLTDALHSGRIAPIHFSDYQMEMEIQLLIARGQWIPAAVKRFAEAFIAAMEESPPA